MSRATEGATPVFAERARRLRWLLLDVDGVLTDGRLYYTGEGEWIKAFEVRDGLGLKLAQKQGLKVGILSGRGAAALEARARELGLDELITQRSDKANAFRSFLERRGVEADHVAYVGDDLLDLPVLLACGLSFAPADAHPEVLRRVDCVLERPGGAGAAREMVERILTARGEWQEIVDRFTALATLP